MSRRKTTEQFIREAREVHEDKYDYSKTIYGKNGREAVQISCGKHGLFKQKPEDHLAGNGCQSCGLEKNSEKRKLTYEKLLNFKHCMALRNIEVDISNYKNSNVGLPCKCLVCGYTWNGCLSKFKIGRGCPRCSGKAHRQISQIKEILLVRNIKVLSEEYKNINTPIECECLICDFIWLSTPKNLINNKSGCPRCVGLVPKILEEIKKELLERNIRVLSEKYINNKTPFECECVICNCKWKAKPDKLLNGKTGCPNCKKSYGEKVVRFVLEVLFKQSFPSIKLKDNKDRRKRLEIDCYSELLINGEIVKLGIEVQGIQHYKPIRFSNSVSQEKSRNDFISQQNRDNIKKRLCKENSIILIEIDNAVHNRTFQERVELVKLTLKENNVPFDDIEITEEQYYSAQLQNFQINNNIQIAS